MRIAYFIIFAFLIPINKTYYNDININKIGVEKKILTYKKCNKKKNKYYIRELASVEKTNKNLAVNKTLNNLNNAKIFKKDELTINKIKPNNIKKEEENKQDFTDKKVLKKQFEINKEQEEVKNYILKEEEKDNNFRYNKIIFKPKVFFTKFSIEDKFDKSRISIMSKANLGFSAIWEQNWTTTNVYNKIINFNNTFNNKDITIDSEFKSRIFINYFKYFFIVNNSNYTLNNQDVYTFGIGLNYTFNSKIKLDFETSYGQDLYFIGYKFDLALVNKNKFSFEYEILKDSNYKLDININGLVNFASKTSSDMITDTQKSIGSSIKLTYKQVNAELAYEHIVKNSEFYKQVQNDASISLSIGFSF